VSKPVEQEKFAQLVTGAERAAFRIVRNFANKARHDRAMDFPIVRDNLGKRLGITGRRAGELRQEFVRLDFWYDDSPGDGSLMRDSKRVQSMEVKFKQLRHNRP
jgi:UTP:GlnB (protein PII) uridylyltransferase